MDRHRNIDKRKEQQSSPTVIIASGFEPRRFDVKTGFVGTHNAHSRDSKDVLWQHRKSREHEQRKQLEQYRKHEQPQIQLEEDFQQQTGSLSQQRQQKQSIEPEQPVEVHTAHEEKFHEQKLQTVADKSPHHHATRKPQWTMDGDGIIEGQRY